MFIIFVDPFLAHTKNRLKTAALDNRNEKIKQNVTKVMVTIKINRLMKMDFIKIVIDENAKEKPSKERTTPSPRAVH